MLTETNEPVAREEHTLIRVLRDTPQMSLDVAEWILGVLRTAEMPPAVAEWVLGTELTSKEQERVSDLSARNQKDELTEAEVSELQRYVRLNDLMIVLRSKARQVLGH